MPEQLAGRTVLVIGGSKNLGRAIAEAAAEHGARVVIGARDLVSAQAVADRIKAQAVRLDVADEASIAEAASSLGVVDHIVITASAHHNVPVNELEPQQVQAAFDAKVVGPMIVAKHFAPHLPADGSIVLFSGIAAWSPAPGRLVMGVTNAAASSLAAHLAVELAPIRVNAVSPGIIDSGVWDGMPEAARTAFFDAAAGGTLAGRVGTRTDIADAVIYLLGASYVTGQTLHIEGGARRL
jgi:NAD(P)-dependent dehydrogenase (short-subunit alcohol dehydrogenase family)